MQKLSVQFPTHFSSEIQIAGRTQSHKRHDRSPIRTDDLLDWNQKRYHCAMRPHLRPNVGVSNILLPSAHDPKQDLCRLHPNVFLKDFVPCPSMHNPLDKNEECLREISPVTSTSQDTTAATLQDCNHSREGHVNQAIQEMPKVVIYLNGMLVNNRFYDFSDPSNLELKSMLDRNEFDREILGINGKHADVLVESRSDYFVGDVSTTVDSKRNISKAIDNVKKLKIEGVRPLNPVRFKYVVGRGRVPMDGAFCSHGSIDSGQETRDAERAPTGMLGLPQEVRLGVSGEVKFKLICANRSTTVFASERMTIGSLVAYIKEKTGETVTLSRRGEVLDENELVQVLRNCMIDVIL